MSTHPASRIRPKALEGFARALLGGAHDAMGRRYLQVRRRHKVLRKGIDRAALEAARSGLSRDARFTPPISVAGVKDEAVLEAAMELAVDGVPVATEFGDHGRHRGTPVGDVAERLGVSEVEAMRLYRQWMAACPALLPYHPQRRYAVIPGMLDRASAELGRLALRLEATMKDLIDDPHVPDGARRGWTAAPSRFTALVTREDLEATLLTHEELLKMAGRPAPPSVLVTFSPAAGVRVDQLPVETTVGQGGGLAVLSRNDLHGLIAQLPGGDVGICAMPEYWVGWIQNEVLQPRTTFSYYEERT